MGCGGFNGVRVLPDLDREVDERGKRCDRCHKFTNVSDILERHFRSLTG